MTLTDASPPAVSSMREPSGRNSARRRRDGRRRAELRSPATAHAAAHFFSAGKCSKSAPLMAGRCASRRCRDDDAPLLGALDISGLSCTGSGRRRDWPPRPIGAIGAADCARYSAMTMRAHGQDDDTGRCRCRRWPMPMLMGLRKKFAGLLQERPPASFAFLDNVYLSCYRLYSPFIY